MISPERFCVVANFATTRALTFLNAFRKRRCVRKADTSEISENLNQIAACRLRSGLRAALIHQLFSLDRCLTLQWPGSCDWKCGTFLSALRSPHGLDILTGRVGLSPPALPASDGAGYDG